MTQRRILASVCALIGSLALGACTSDASLRVTNNSDYSIVDIRLTQIDNPDFGPNLIGGDTLEPDESITISVDCDTYDAQIIDEDGVTCTLQGVDLCLNDADWVINNNTCDFVGLRKKQAEAAAKAKAAGQAPAQPEAAAK